MPLLNGSSKSTIGKNIAEFHKGKTFAKTAAKFGKKKADKQAIAVAFAQARRSGSKSKMGRTV
jgi:aminoglycoside phosphotransferase family enzyme